MVNKNRSFVRQYLNIFFLVAVSVAALYAANTLIKRYQRLQTDAATGTVQLFFEPGVATFPPDSSVNIWVTASQGIAFARVTYSFDPAQLRLTATPTIASPVLSKIIMNTPYATANAAGKGTIVIALPAGISLAAPSGTIKLAALTFSSATASPNVSTSLSFGSDTQIIDTSAVPFAITFPTSTPQPAPVSTVDTTPPVIAITSPGNGTTISRHNLEISASASDASGISSLKLYVDGVLVKSCSNTRTCSDKYGTNSLSHGNHTITATAADNSTLQNVSKMTITFSK